MTYPHNDALTIPAMMAMAIAFYNHVEENDELDNDFDTFKAFLGKDAPRPAYLYDLTMDILSTAHQAIPIDVSGMTLVQTAAPGTEPNLITEAAADYEPDFDAHEHKLPFIELFLELNDGPVPDAGQRMKKAFKKLPADHPLSLKISDSRVMDAWGKALKIVPDVVNPNSGLTYWEMHCLSDHFYCIPSEDGCMLEFMVDPIVEDEFLATMKTLLVGFTLVKIGNDPGDGVQRIVFSYIG